MSPKKIVIAGGTGFIGEYLAARYANQGHKVVIISRFTKLQAGNVSYVLWDGKTIDTWANEIDGADLLINLAGKSVNCRYNDANMRAIYDSRTGSTMVLGEAIAKAKNPPKLWINSSTATIYRHAEDRPMDEDNGDIGTGFSVDVARKWEKAFFDCDTPNTRKVALRIAIVLGPRGGVMVPYRNLAKLGLGGKQGSGKQMFSWVHIDDVASIIDFLETHPQLEGVYNVSAPNPVNNKEFTRLVRYAYGVKVGLPATKLMLELGAILIGTETELLLKSRWVLPKRLIAAGYNFKFPELAPALADIVAAESN